MCIFHIGIKDIEFWLPNGLRDAAHVQRWRLALSRRMEKTRLE